MNIGRKAERYCKQCETVKRLHLFYRHRGCKDGRMNVCKECHKQNVRENRQFKREFYIERE